MEFACLLYCCLNTSKSEASVELSAKHNDPVCLNMHWFRSSRDSNARTYRAVIWQSAVTCWVLSHLYSLTPLEDRCETYYTHSQVHYLILGYY